jgi:leucyl-tRNA synthetase
MSSNPDEPRSCARTDFLCDIESEVQRSWDESKVFEADPGSGAPGPSEKFFGNFPYP